MATMLAGVRPATAIEYRRDLEAYVLPRIGGMRIGALDARRIRKLAYDLRKEPTKRAPSGRSWATVRRILAPLSVMLSAATEDGVIPARPWPRLPTPRRDPLKRRHLSVEELARLLGALPTPQDRLLVRFLAETGLRISELKAIRWGDLDLDDEPVVRVRRRHRLLDGEQETKSERSSGTVPITPQLARELRRTGSETASLMRSFWCSRGYAADDSTKATIGGESSTGHVFARGLRPSASMSCDTRTARSWPRKRETSGPFNDDSGMRRPPSLSRRMSTFLMTGLASMRSGRLWTEEGRARAIRVAVGLTCGNRPNVVSRCRMRSTRGPREGASGQQWAALGLGRPRVLA
jgi:integrase